MAIPLIRARLMGTTVPNGFLTVTLSVPDLGSAAAIADKKLDRTLMTANMGTVSAVDTEATTDVEVTKGGTSVTKKITEAATTEAMEISTSATMTMKTGFAAANHAVEAGTRSMMTKTGKYSR